MPQLDYLLSSERLGFRLPEDADFDNFKKLDMNPEVRAQFPDGVLTSEQIKKRISGVAVLAQESLRALLAWAKQNLDVPRIVKSNLH